jgi:hypothetical protein
MRFGPLNPDDTKWNREVLVNVITGRNRYIPFLESSLITFFNTDSPTKDEATGIPGKDPTVEVHTNGQDVRQVALMECASINVLSVRSRHGASGSGSHNLGDNAGYAIVWVGAGWQGPDPRIGGGLFVE